MNVILLIDALCVSLLFWFSNEPGHLYLPNNTIQTVRKYYSIDLRIIDLGSLTDNLSFRNLFNK